MNATIFFNLVDDVFIIEALMPFLTLEDKYGGFPFHGFTGEKKGGLAMVNKRFFTIMNTIGRHNLRGVTETNTRYIFTKIFNLQSYGTVSMKNEQKDCIMTFDKGIQHGVTRRDTYSRGVEYLPLMLTKSPPDSYTATFSLIDSRSRTQISIETLVRGKLVKRVEWNEFDQNVIKIYSYPYKSREWISLKRYYKFLDRETNILTLMINETLYYENGDEIDLPTVEIPISF